MKRVLPIRTDFLKKGLLAISVISYLAFVHFRGIIFSDEGYILNSAWRMTLGQVPYRDFEMVYTPASFLAVFGAFKLFGVSVLSGRVVMFFVSIVTFGFIFKIIRRFSSSLVVATLGALVYLVWGPGQINFPWPAMFAIAFGVMTTFSLIKEPKTEKLTLAAGFFGAMIVLAKQNLGTGLLLADTLVLVVLFRSRLRPFLTGIFGGFGVWFTYLVANGATTAFFNNLYFHTFQKILVEGTISTPFAFVSAKGLFYLLPIIVSGLASWILFKNHHHQRWLPVPILGAAFYIFGIRPVTDYNHLVPLLALSGLSLAILNRFTRTAAAKLIAVIGLMGLVTLGFYQSLWGGYYRWGEPLVRQNVYLADNRVRVWATEDSLKQVTDLNKFFNGQTTEKDKIFVNIYLPMVYFVTNRQNATRFDYFSDTATSKDQQMGMVEDIEREEVKYVVNNQLNLNPNSSLKDYLEREFEPVASSGAFVFLGRSGQKPN